MEPNIRLSERLGVLGTIDPASCAGTSAFTDYVDMAKARQCLFLLCTGNMASAMIDFKVYGYTDLSASNPTLIKSATQLAAAGSTNDNKQVMICVDDTEVNGASAAKSLRYIRGKVIATGPVCVAAIGETRHGPSDAGDLASVVEIVD